MRVTSERPSRVLVVEDNPGDAELVAALLAADGRVDVDRADTLAAACRALAGAPYDVVLLDLWLPDEVGSTCVAAVHAAAPDTPIVALTGLDDEAVALASLAAGAHDYLAKADLRASTLRRVIGFARARATERRERARAEALQARLAAIVEGSSDAIVSTTPEGIVTSWNGGAARIFGVAETEALGHALEALVPPPPPSSNAAATGRGLLDALAAESEGDAVELVRLRRDGAAVNLSVVASRLRDGSGLDLGVAAICRDVTAWKRRDDELRHRNAELVERDRQMRALTARLNAVREEERARISREVHDELGQLLTGVKMDLRWVGKHAARDAAGAAERLAEAEHVVEQAISAVQRIAIELRPSALDVLGLGSAVRDEARRFARRTGLAVEIAVAEDVEATETVATALFRILQELLANVARHAHASAVRVALRPINGAVELLVEDDGVGLSAEAARRPTSLGLLGIRERAEELGGEARVEAAAPRGTVATVRIPCDDGAASGGEVRCATS